jgi:hypothetical protein
MATNVAVRGRILAALDVEGGLPAADQTATLSAMAEAAPSAEQQLEEIRTQLAWVRDYL